MAKLGQWIKQFKAFGAETWEEVQKCSWPDRSELKSHTGLVIVALVLVGAFVYGVDQVCQVLIRTLILG
jgi:preprotein translocase SecE subunit